MYRNRAVEAAGRWAGGFTLVELMVVIALLAGLGFYAAPVAEQWRVRERVDARTRALLGALTFARAEAVRLGVRVTLCRAGDTGQCLRAGEPCDAVGWSCGWVVRAHVDDQVHVLRRYPRDAEVLVTGAARDLSFAPPAGQVAGGLRRFELRPRKVMFAADDTRSSRCVRIAAGGRARVANGRCEAVS